jgi:3alpha(or 20beta)-hydroxysteroid dehydrogenase
MVQWQAEYRLRSNCRRKEKEMGKRLEGKVALITGAARGMGAADARRFVAEGAQVLVTDVLDRDGEQLAEELGETAQYVHLDVSSEQEWATTVGHAVETFGKLNVLVNNAGIDHMLPIQDETLEAFDRTIKVNLYGTFLGMRAVARPMKQGGGGSIVNISSMAAIRAFGGGSAYGASKWAIRGITKIAAIDLGKLGIRVNSVHPGPIDTPMLAAPADSPHFTSLPVPRCGTVEDVANLLVFLASDESSFITGAEHLIDGGYSL